MGQIAKPLANAQAIFATALVVLAGCAGRSPQPVAVVHRKTAIWIARQSKRKSVLTTRPFKSSAQRRVARSRKTLPRGWPVWSSGRYGSRWTFRARLARKRRHFKAGRNTSRRSRYRKAAPGHRQE
jgi:hypothetical protein